MNTSVPIPTLNKCSQCKKAYKPGVSSVGCLKCAPGVKVSEVEFQKPLALASKK